jgi:hypothetical protein
MGAKRLAQRFGWFFLVRLPLVLIAVGFSGVDVAFGLYPASKAARLDPIEAGARLRVKPGRPRAAERSRRHQSRNPGRR